MYCPVCNSELTVVEYEGVAIFACVACGGHLTTPVSLAEILIRRWIVFSENESRRLASSLSNARLSDRELRRKLPCPKCQRRLVARKFQCCSPITINKCTSARCSCVWLDLGELEDAQRYVEGLELIGERPIWLGHRESE